jgi:protein SCO1/2
MALVLVVLGPHLLYGQAVPPPKLKGVNFKQRLNEQVPLDLRFKDETGKPVKLGDYFHDRPVVLIPYYSRCPMLCPLILRGITRGMSEVKFTIGKDFNVVSVSFDPQETPAVAAKTKDTYVQLYNRPGAAEGWHFLTGDQDAIKALMDAVGYHYVYDAKKDMFKHPAGIVVLTPSGKISRYLYGVDFAPRDLRLALVEASAGKVGSPTDQVLLYCFHYDPSAGKYTASVMTFIRAGGVLTILVVGGFVWLLARRHRRAGLQSEAAAGAPAAETPAGPSDAGEEGGGGAGP